MVLIRYKVRTFRIDDELYEEMQDLRLKNNRSWNMLFWDFVRFYSKITNKKMTRLKFEVMEGDDCPHCEFGKIVKKASKYGEFYACDQFPHCAFTQHIKTEMDIGMKGYKEK